MKLKERLRWVLKQDWFRFCVVGVTAWVIHFSFSTLVFSLLKQFGQSLAVCNRAGYATGAVFAIIYAFILNKIWTFQDKGKEVGKQGLMFFFGRGISFFLTFMVNILIVEMLSPAVRTNLADHGLVVWLLGHLGKTATPDTNHQLDFIFSQGFNGVLSFVINFFWAKFLVFRPGKNATTR